MPYTKSMKEKEMTPTERLADMLHRAKLLVNSEDFYKFQRGMDLYEEAEEYAKQEGLDIE